MRSIPEKTLEHWCSIHLSYRYRAKLRMWWPTQGQDIDASGGPLAPGKRIWLELKTTEWNNAAKRHDLTIDLAQLTAYGRASVPDFYVFPLPPWDQILGKIPKPGWAGTLDPSDFAYESHSNDKWFPHWLYVVPGSVLRRIVSTMTTTSNDLRIAEVTAGTVKWRITQPADDEILLWRDFWKKMETCGDNGPFAAQFVLPTGTPSLSLPPAPAASVPDSPDSPTAPRSSRDTTTWAALKTASAALKKANQEADGSPKHFEPDSLRLWTPKDGTFLASSPDETTTVGDDFVWDGEVGRSMVLLSVDALRFPKQ